MCKAHILRFACHHGVLMSLDPCNLGPCPLLKTTSDRLPIQPYKCYKCQYRLASNASSPPSISRNSSNRSSQESLNSNNSASSSTPFAEPASKRMNSVCHPLPGVAVQPHNTARMSSFSRTSSGRSFSFSCNDSSHFATPHYTSLPEYLPHQNHACPPCQLEEYRARADAEAIRVATIEHPNLKAEMLVRDGRVWEDWQSKPSLEKYIDEKRTDEREMWFHVTRKWTQDLKRVKVLVAEEDGLGLIG